MAIYHLSVKTISRNQGRSSVGAAAYRAGEKLHNEYDGLTHDYTPRNRGMIAAAAYRSGENLSTDNANHDFTKKAGIAYKEIILPDHAPSEFADRQTLWNAVEKAEKRRDARTAREVEIALPNELTLDEQINLVRGFVSDTFISQGMIADIAIHGGHKNAHDKDADHIEAAHDTMISPNNPHAHILLTDRPVERTGFSKLKNRDWNNRSNIEKWREAWARAQNREFERKKLNIRVRHESYERQGVDREPTIHLGHEAAALEKQGIRTNRGDRNRAIEARNRER